jgi:methylaspartate ammonia-lyase
MVFHRLDALPHTQVDDVAAQFGPEGEILLEYARWVAERVRRESDYRPALHFDIHGAAGKVFEGDIARIAAFTGKLGKATRGFECRLESPVIEPTLERQIETLAALRRKVASGGSGVLLVADEWANTRSDIRSFLHAEAVDMVHIKMPDLGGLDESLESVLACRVSGVKSLLGGSCIETDLSSKLSVHVALAARPDVLLVKPGMGIHEAVSLQRNEMGRVLARGGRDGMG